MPSPPLPRIDLARITLRVAFIAILIIGCFWVVYPFLLAAVWAAMLSIATWPLLLWLQAHLPGRRWTAVTVLTLCWIFLFIFPIAMAINSIIDTGPALTNLTTSSKQWTAPALEWLNDIPVVGQKLYRLWNQMLADGGNTLFTRLQPYFGRSITWFISQISHVGMFVIQSMLMIVFTTLFYFNGEAIGRAIRHFAYRLSQERGVSTVILATQSIRAVALGVVGTALIQSILGGIGMAIAGVNYIVLLSTLMFVSCVAQLGPMPVILSCVAYLYWGTDQVLASVLLLAWGLVITSFDSMVRPFLIRRGANLPLILIFGGVIGGLLVFGMLGLFLGPVILAVSWTLASAWVKEVDYPEDAAGDAESILTPPPPDVVNASSDTPKTPPEP